MTAAHEHRALPSVSSVCLIAKPRRTASQPTSGSAPIALLPATASIQVARIPAVPHAHRPPVSADPHITTVHPPPVPAIPNIACTRAGYDLVTRRRGRPYDDLRDGSTHGTESSNGQYRTSHNGMQFHSQHLFVNRFRRTGENAVGREGDDTELLRYLSEPQSTNGFGPQWLSDDISVYHPMVVFGHSLSGTHLEPPRRHSATGVHSGV